MSGGTLIRVIPKTMFDLGWVPASTTDGVIVAKALNVIPYNSAYLWVRVYRRQVGTGASARISVTGALPAEDTQQSFLEATSTNLIITGTAPVLLSTAITTPLAPYLQIEVQGTQPASATNIGIEISVDVLLRCCG